jgi:6,7-dimethyl-8-ribityllumazine synthase
MATALKNLSEYDPANIPDASGFRFGIVVAEWHHEITGAMLEGARSTLIKHGAKAENILVYFVPGSFELTYSAKWLAENRNFDVIICIGCIIQGETRHFDFICQSVTQGITQLNINYNIPFIFGVLTTQNLQQAIDRAGGKHGNKGDEAAITAIKMAYYRKILIDE